MCPRCGARRVDAQLGLEPTLDCLGWATGAPCGACYVCHLVAAFREVWRVLRDDGVAWLNLGDSYAGSGKGHTKGGTVEGDKQGTNRGSLTGMPWRPGAGAPGLKPKDLCFVPARVALALQADGWWVRSDVVWHKKNPMPESTTDRPTRSHEFLFLLAKRARYAYDADAIREPHTALGRPPGNTSRVFLDRDPQHHTEQKRRPGQEHSFHPVGRNKRDVWTLATAPFSGAHFATFPPDLVEPCILAGTSEKGCCPQCGAPWRRVTQKVGVSRQRWAPGEDQYHTRAKGKHGATSAFTTGDVAVRATVGWAPTCRCGAPEPVPCTVLDPFGGAGTTVLVADRLGRHGIGLELSAEYARMAYRRVYEDAPLWAGRRAVRKARARVRRHQSEQLALDVAAE